MNTTVIIVTHESALVLDDTLTALDRIPGLTTLIVDNASTDTSAAIAESHGARVLRLPKNVGFAAAANKGVQAAQGEILCFLNPDCLLDETTVAAAVAALSKHPRSCAVPDFEQGEGRVAGCQPGYTRRKLLADILETNGWNPGWIAQLKAHPDYHDMTWNWPLGTCMFVQSSFFNEVGGLDASYFLYMEDVDFGQRIDAAGGTTLPIGTTLRHLSMHGAGVPRGRRMELLNAGRLLYARKTYGLCFTTFLRGVLAVTQWKAGRAVR